MIKWKYSQCCDFGAGKRVWMYGQNGVVVEIAGIVCFSRMCQRKAANTWLSRGRPENKCAETVVSSLDERILFKDMYLMELSDT